MKVNDYRTVLKELHHIRNMCCSPSTKPEDNTTEALSNQLDNLYERVKSLEFWILNNVNVTK